MKIRLTNLLRLREAINPLELNLGLKEKDPVKREYPQRRLHSSLSYIFEK